MAVSIYERLGVRPLINAAGDLTRLGGTLMEPEVLAAMAEAAGAFVQIGELQERAGLVIAGVTGAEAGYVTSGAAAGLVLGTAACLTGTDQARMRALPNTSSFPRHRVLIQASHCTGYERMFGVCGAAVATVGDEEELAAELARGDVAAVAFIHERVERGVPIEQVVELARTHDVPVIVDAAAALPPPENLRRYTAAGADLVAFSGGKALHGPQASGILCGRADLIRAVALQHQDMDVDPGLFGGPVPGHGLGRPMKVGKEEIAGAVAALELYARRDHAAERRRWKADMRLVADALADVPGVRARYAFPLPNRRPLPCVLIELDQSKLGQTAVDVLRALEAGDPPIVLNDHQADRGVIMVYPSNLRPGEASLVADRLLAALAPSRGRKVPSGRVGGDRELRGQGLKRAAGKEGGQTGERSGHRIGTHRNHTWRGGGKPRVAGHRITVQDIVIWHERLGRSADEIATEYDLSLADVYAALAYYFDHREQIDRLIEESAQAAYTP